MSDWRVAPAVLAIFKQADLQAPDRNDASDGTVGDTRHSAAPSDHNPDASGWVYAGDLTDDDISGIDCREIARQIVARRDRRVKYLISEGRMVSSYATSRYPAWTWRPYSGPNGHFKHLHVSVLSQWRNDTSPWWTPPSTTPKDEEFVMASKAELEAVVNEAVVKITGGARRRDAEGKVVDPDPQNISNADIYTKLEELLAAVKAK